MSVIPDTKVGKIEYCESHNAPWTANAVAIGTTSAAVSALGTLTTAARAAYNAQLAAQDAAKDAVGNANIAINAMEKSASDIIKQVRAKASISGDGVFTLASIPIPPVPSPIPAPGTPTNFNAALDPDGNLLLSWKCANPAGSQGTTYQIFRKTASASDFTFIGSGGKKSFLDNTVPAGSAPITYRIVAVRSTVQGTAGVFVVNFGVSGGMMVASVITAPRMAA